MNNNDFIPMFELNLNAAIKDQNDEMPAFNIEIQGGAKGQKGDPGEKGDPGVGEQGPPGEQGIPGIQGPPGDPGATGNGIASIEQTTTAIEDEGVNIITITETNGTTSTFQVKNGSKGDQGEQGEQGIPGKDGKDGQDGQSGQNGQDGATGPYFTPSVNADGDLSWTNNGGLNNPTTVNIKGPQGPQGIPGPTGTSFEAIDISSVFAQAISSQTPIEITSQTLITQLNSLYQNLLAGTIAKCYAFKYNEEGNVLIEIATSLISTGGDCEITAIDISNDMTIWVSYDPDINKWYIYIYNSHYIDEKEVKNSYSNVSGQVYDVTYINTMLGNIESLLGGI